MPTDDPIIVAAATLVALERAKHKSTGIEAVLDYGAFAVRKAPELARAVQELQKDLNHARRQYELAVRTDVRDALADNKRLRAALEPIASMRLSAGDMIATASAALATQPEPEKKP